MHMVLDFNPVMRDRFSGFWTYGWLLLRGLVARQDVQRVSLLCERSRLEACGDALAGLGPKIAPATTGTSMHRWGRWWRLVPWPGLARWCGPFDVYHSIHNLMPPANGRPRVMTVHDLRRYRLPELIVRSRTESFERAVRLADRLIAISQSTRRDLIELLGVDPGRIDVVPLAVGEEFQPACPARAAATRDWLSRQAGRPVDRYVVCISSRDARKNIPTVLQAFARAAKNLPPEVCLVVAGVLCDNEPFRQAMAQSALAGRVVLTGPVSHERFLGVMAAAEMLVFLSLYEGFGLPVAEAMASGVPVIAADNSSMPEVAGAAGILIDAHDVAAAAKAMAQLANDPARRQALAKAGLEQAGLFSVDRLAEGTLRTYRKALEGSD